MKALSIKKIRSLFSEDLPVGMKEFDTWVNDVSSLSGLPVNPKLKQVIANMILQVPPGISKIPKNHIVRLIRKAAANQVAVEALSLINEKEKSAQQADAKPVGDNKNLG